MKKKIILSLLVSVFLFTTASKALAADKYLGNFCWQVFNSAGQPYWIYKFGVYEKEGGHLSLFGSIGYGANGPSAAHGNAISIGGNIKMTIVSSDYEEAEGQVWSETFTATLNASTLSGQWNALSLESDDGINAITKFQMGSMSPIACN